MLSPALLPFCISSSAQRESHSSALCKSFVVLKKILPGESRKLPGSHTAKSQGCGKWEQGRRVGAAEFLSVRNAECDSLG